MLCTVGPFVRRFAVATIGFAVLAALPSAPAQAFFFCFSFGGGSNNSSGWDSGGPPPPWHGPYGPGFGAIPFAAYPPGPYPWSGYAYPGSAGVNPWPNQTPIPGAQPWPGYPIAR